MKCDVASCSSRATLLVMFRHHRMPVPYCHYHSHDRKGELRWKPYAVLSVQKMD